MSSELPSKLFFRIGEVAGLVGVEPHVLRYWEREFRSIRPTKSAKGQRVYSRKDVENLLRVRDLLYRDGFTIAGAKKRLQRGAVPEEESAADAEPPSGVQDHDFAAEEASSESAVESAPSSRQRDALEVALEVNRGVDAAVREKLTALRTEVEAFLHELET